MQEKFHVHKWRKKVHEEYKKYSQHTLTPVEKDYLEGIRSIENIAKRGGK